MKRYTSFLHFILLQVVIMMTSCSPDDTYTDNLTTKPGAAKPLCISVNRTDFLSDSKNAETRTTHDDAFAASFKNDDRIGIIGISGGTVVFNNLEYKYNNGTWEAVGDICYAQANMTYIAYYPYSTTMNGKKSEAEILNAFTVPTDQRNQKDENDLMAATINVTTSQSQLTFSMKHLLCLLVLQEPKSYIYRWDNKEIPVTLEGDDIKSDNEFTYNGTNYTINIGTKYLLVKPGSNITIKATRNSDYSMVFSCQKTGINTTANKCHNVNFTFKLTKNNDQAHAEDPFYKTADNFGFPCPNNWKIVPPGCTKVGTVVCRINNDRKVYFHTNNSSHNEGIDNQTYKTINNETLTNIRGYVVSEYVHPKGPLFKTNRYGDVPLSTTLEQYKAVHGFTYTYTSKAFDEMLSKGEEECPPYEYLRKSENHLSNTSKWFIPGIAEANSATQKRYNDGRKFWTCERVNNESAAQFMYCSCTGVSPEINNLPYISELYTLFMLAF